MRKILLTFTVMLSSTSYAGRIVGNPGGGIQRDGVYMTFGSAGINLPVDPEPLETVPGTAVIRGTVLSMGLNEYQKSEIWQAIMPFGARKYYNITKDKFDKETYEKLVEEYAKVTQQPKESIVIFAATDPKTRVTFLLPEFYNLNEDQQSEILFHEGYWIMKPQATYSEVVAAEIAFSRYVSAFRTGGYDRKLGEKLAVLFNSPETAINMDLAWDLRARNFSTINVSNDGILVANLVGDAIEECVPESGLNVFVIRLNKTRELNHIYALVESNPKSIFLKTLLNFLSPEQDGFLREMKIEVFPHFERNDLTDCFQAVNANASSIKLFGHVEKVLWSQAR
jgi:hypothetical protein